MIKEWIKKLEINDDNGLISLLNLFECEEDFCKHFIENSIFINKDKVKKQELNYIQRLESKETFPVRYTMKTNKYFHYENNNTNIAKLHSKKSFKNRKDAKTFSENTAFIHAETNIKVIIDGNGNQFVKKEIENNKYNLENIISKTNFKNFVICHIWSKTHHPLFFTSLWNIVLIPAYLAFLTDKPASQNLIIKKIQLILKALCFKLYKPNNIYNEHNLFTDAEIKEIDEGIGILEKFEIKINVNFI